ncbi:MAG: hypothetical protein EBU28_12365 [Gammaproteobacteria bacterium]|nr:hypothetical protein [Gammaproteobacteria bacterium]
MLRVHCDLMREQCFTPLKRKANQPIWIEREDRLDTLLTAISSLSGQADQIIHADRFEVHAVGDGDHVFQ